MKKCGKNGRIYTLEEIHRIINTVAQKKLGISGTEAIQAINNDDWEYRGNIDIWVWLKGLVWLLSSELPERGAKDACIQQKIQRAVQ